MVRTHRFRSSAALAVVLAPAMLLIAVAVAGCSSSTTTTGSPTPGSSVAAASPSPTAKPLPAPTVAGTIVFTRLDWPHPAFDIYIANTDGTGFKQLTQDGEATNPSWSPDGSKIVCSASGGIAIVNADGSSQTMLVKGSATEPSWSPDGKWIAFTRETQPGGGGWAICVIKPDGSGLKRLTDGSGKDIYPSWTADGRISFGRSTKNKVYTVKLDGSGLAPQGRFVGVLSPDGSRRAMAKGDRVLVMPVSGGGTAVTVLHPLKDFIADDQFATTWAPDGTALAVASNQYEHALGSRIYIVNADGSGLSAVPGVDYAFNPVWQPR
jgi:Tol biopolymer transport system component